MSPACVAAAIDRPTRHRVYNVSDDEPAPPQDVVAYAAELLGLPVPPEIAFEAAGLGGMAATFWAECKRVDNARIKTELGAELLYPTYREGLQALAATRAARFRWRSAQLPLSAANVDEIAHPVAGHPCTGRGCVREEQCLQRPSHAGSLRSLPWAC